MHRVNLNIYTLVLGNCLRKIRLGYIPYIIYTGRNGPLQKGENSLVKELRAGVGECSLLFSHRCNLTSRVLCTDCVGELHSHMYLSQVSFIEVQDCAACVKIAYVDVCHLA